MRRKSIVCFLGLVLIFGLLCGPVCAAEPAVTTISGDSTVDITSTIRSAGTLIEYTARVAPKEGTGQPLMQVQIHSQIWRHAATGDFPVYSGTPVVCNNPTVCEEVGNFTPEFSGLYWANVTVQYTVQDTGSGNLVLHEVNTNSLRLLHAPVPGYGFWYFSIVHRISGDPTEYTEINGVYDNGITTRNHPIENVTVSNDLDSIDIAIRPRHCVDTTLTIYQKDMRELMAWGRDHHVNGRPALWTWGGLDTYDVDAGLLNITSVAPDDCKRLDNNPVTPEAGLIGCEVMLDFTPVRTLKERGVSHHEIGKTLDNKRLVAQPVWTLNPVVGPREVRVPRTNVWTNEQVVITDASPDVHFAITGSASETIRFFNITPEIWMKKPSGDVPVYKGSRVICKLTYICTATGSYDTSATGPGSYYVNSSVLYNAYDPAYEVMVLKMPVVSETIYGGPGA